MTTLCYSLPGGEADTLKPAVDRIEASQVTCKSVYEVERNDTAARRWAVTHCPGGSMRRFGPCEERGGVVVQRRAGETHIVAVAFDVRVTTENSVIDLTFVFRAVGDVGAT